MMLGTPQYISPEQARGLRDLGPATDIYSLGVVIYELVVGRVPFNADTPYSIIHDHIYTALPLPTEVNAEVPLLVEQVLLRALAKEPEARYASATQMVEALRAAFEDSSQPVMAMSVPSPQDQTALPPDFGTPMQITPTTEWPDTTVPPALSPEAARARKRHGKLWKFGGIGALLLICLASLFLIARTVSDSETPSQPTTNPSDNQPPPSPLPIGQLPELSLAEAQALVAQYPDDPLAHLALALAAAKEDNRELTYLSLATATRLLNDPSGERTALIARQATRAGYTDLATWLYLDALTRSKLTPNVRNEAGSFLYSIANSNPLQTRITTSLFADRREPNALVSTFHALAILQANRALAQRQAMKYLSEAFQADEDIAEAYLVRGLYYQATGQIDNAMADWTHAAQLDNAPDWVKFEAHELQRAYQP